MPDIWYALAAGAIGDDAPVGEDSPPWLQLPTRRRRDPNVRWCRRGGRGAPPYPDSAAYDIVAGRGGVAYNATMQKLQIVIDTSVLLAGLRSSRGQTFRLLHLVGTGRIYPYRSSSNTRACCCENSLISLSPSVVEDVINFYCAVTNRHQIFFLWRPFLRDPQDDMVLELAVKAGCDAIVTYNQRDFAGVEEAFQIRVVAPGEFLKDIGA
jgi:predicted nucleic acid-binding protein